LVGESSCPNCKAKYSAGSINIIASTNTEALFELKCTKCESTGIANIVITPTNEKIYGINRIHKGVSQDEVLDVKNFLNNFDGNFKKIFSKEE